MEKEEILARLAAGGLTVDEASLLLRHAEQNGGFSSAQSDGAPTNGNCLIQDAADLAWDTDEDGPDEIEWEFHLNEDPQFDVDEDEGTLVEGIEALPDAESLGPVAAYVLQQREHTLKEFQDELDQRNLQLASLLRLLVPRTKAGSEPGEPERFLCLGYLHHQQQQMLWRDRLEQAVGKDDRRYRAYMAGWSGYSPLDEPVTGLFSWAVFLALLTIAISVLGLLAPL